MAFTAKDVMALREMSGAGMMDCKRALVETDGDMDKAMEYLREKSLAATAKKASRIAAEGIVDSYIHMGGKIGVLLEVNCETDFVAKTDDFTGFVKDVADAVVKSAPAEALDALLAAPYPNSDKTVGEMIPEKVLVIGENLKVRRFARYCTGVTVPYIHMAGRIGVLVNMEVEGIEASAVTELGKDLCMQVAAMNPSFCDKADVDQATLDKEKEIQLALMDNDPKMASKPLQVKEKIVLGKMSKYYEENCLMQMEFVQEKGVSVEQHVAAVAKELGGKIAVKSFVRFERGEGIEKKREDFAAEVAAQMNMGK